MSRLSLPHTAPSCALRPVLPQLGQSEKWCPGPALFVPGLQRPRLFPLHRPVAPVASAGPAFRPLSSLPGLAQLCASGWGSPPGSRLALCQERGLVYPPRWLQRPGESPYSQAQAADSPQLSHQPRLPGLPFYTEQLGTDRCGFPASRRWDSGRQSVPRPPCRSERMSPERGSPVGALLLRVQGLASVWWWGGVDTHTQGDRGPGVAAGPAPSAQGAALQALEGGPCGHLCAELCGPVAPRRTCCSPSQDTTAGKQKPCLPKEFFFIFII